MIKKISIIGAGYVGSSIAYSLMLIEAAEEIALIDVNPVAVNAEVADIRPGLSAISPSKVYRGSYADAADSDIIIVTAGVSRKPNESRLDLIGKNAAIAREIAQNLKANDAHGIVVVVSNPVDVITRIFAEESNELSGRVFGTGCILDSARFRSVLADFLNVSEASVQAFVAGEHGAGQVPLWSSVRINGNPVELNEADKQKIAAKVANTGAEIIAGKGRTHYGIAGCVAYIVNEMKEHHQTLLSLTFPVPAGKACVSRPCMLTENGVKEIEACLSEAELTLINQAMAKLERVTNG